MTLTAKAWLRMHRARLGQTQHAAAEAVGVSRATWARWEAEDLLPSLEAFHRLATWADSDLDTVSQAFGLSQ